MAKAEIEQKRAEIAALALGGLSQREVATIMEMSVGNVNYHLQIIRKRWREQQLGDIQKVMVEDLTRIQFAITSIWQDVMEGDLKAIDRLESLINLRSRILGYQDLETHIHIGEGATFKITDLLVNVTDQEPTIDQVVEAEFLPVEVE